MKKSTMRFLITSLSFLLFLSSAYCQKSKTIEKRIPKVQTKTEILGKILATGASITGIEYAFPNRIDTILYDATNLFLTVHLRDPDLEGGNPKRKGSILQYDLKNKEILWMKEMGYYQNLLLKFDNQLIFNNIDNNKLFGFNLVTQNISWEREINKKFGINDIFYLNDTTLMVIASGLNTININNGLGWDYRAITSEANKSVSIDAVGTMLGLLEGVIGAFIVQEAGFQFNIGIVSNVLVDGSSIYFASKEQMVKLDENSGEVVWKFPFKNKDASKSTLLMDDSVVYMVNRGYSFFENNKVQSGKPFIAAFNKQTGERKYIKYTLNKDGFIYNEKIFNNELYLFFNRKIEKYCLETGSVTLKKKLKKTTLNQIDFIQKNKVFTLHQDGFIDFISQTDSALMNFSTPFRFLSVDKDLNIVKALYKDEIYASFLSYGDYELISNNKKTYIIDSEGKIIAELNVSKNAFLMDGVLYDKRYNSIVAIDLKDIID